MNIDTKSSSNADTSERIGYYNARKKVRAIASPVFLVTQIITFLLFMYGYTSNGFVIFGVPMLFSIIAALLYLYPKRHNPDYILYVFFHPSKNLKWAIIAVLLIWICLSLYAFQRQ